MTIDWIHVSSRLEQYLKHVVVAFRSGEMQWRGAFKLDYCIWIAIRFSYEEFNSVCFAINNGMPELSFSRRLVCLRSASTLGALKPYGLPLGCALRQVLAAVVVSLSGHEVSLGAPRRCLSLALLVSVPWFASV